MADGVRVVGVGNASRGDDAVGPAVAAEVAVRVDPDIEVVVSSTDPSRLIDRFGSAELVVLIDAMAGHPRPGAVEVFDAGEEPLPTSLDTTSSHGTGVSAAVELARALGRLPNRLMVVGVAGSRFEGVGLTHEVEYAVEDAVQAVLEVVADA